MHLPEPRYLDPTRQFWRAFGSDSSTRLPFVAAMRREYDKTINRAAAPHDIKPPLPVVFYRVCDFIAPDVDAVGRVRVGNDPKVRIPSRRGGKRKLLISGTIYAVMSRPGTGSA